MYVSIMPSSHIPTFLWTLYVCKCVAVIYVRMCVEIVYVCVNNAFVPHSGISGPLRACMCVMFVYASVYAFV